ncbi:XkdF-like putative serine protease domain-containing protein [Ectothiorhodospira mobilis]|uniref:XkdF-like putative serine protease domain-containing protein n=1 Tax=Ectothiorhodospira mobilis TaxID=195064 RepID=UPI001903C881|nr:XkdF-like putative serine protease domain-containing protein [Ectothiorhodospira mobilis]MBK1690988.1 hypothetical protein [Ectothiorhodospira mobilis]
MAKLIDLNVRWISLVRRPANGEGLVLKAEDGGAGIVLSHLKAEPAMQRLFGVIYAPDVEDAQGDWADAETIRRAADAFMRAGRTIAVDREHDFDPVGAYVAESWIVRAGDAYFPELEGAWAVGIQVEDGELWSAIERGDISGLSLAGTAGTSDEPAPRKGVLRNFFETFRKPEQEKAMDEERLKSLVADQVRATLDERDRAEQAKSDREAEKAERENLQQSVSDLTETVKSLKQDVEAMKKSEPAGDGEGEPGAGDDDTGNFL